MCRETALRLVSALALSESAPRDSVVSFSGLLPDAPRDYLNSLSGECLRADPPDTVPEFIYPLKAYTLASFVPLLCFGGIIQYMSLELKP